MFSLIKIKTPIQEETTTTTKHNRLLIQNQKYHARQDTQEFLDTEYQANSITFRQSTVNSVHMDHCFLPNLIFIIVFVRHPIWSLFTIDCIVSGFFFLLFLTQSVDYFFYQSTYLYIYCYIWVGYFLYCSANKMCIAIIYYDMLNAFYMESTL